MGLTTSFGGTIVGISIGESTGVLPNPAVGNRVGIGGDTPGSAVGTGIVSCVGGDATGLAVEPASDGTESIFADGATVLSIGETGTFVEGCDATGDGDWSGSLEEESVEVGDSTDGAGRLDGDCTPSSPKKS